MPLTQFAERAWRWRVAWCPQNAFVFDSSLRGNLLLSRARADASDESGMPDALHRAGLGPLLDSLAGGFDTLVGGGGPALRASRVSEVILASTTSLGSSVRLVLHVRHEGEPTVATWGVRTPDAR